MSEIAGLIARVETAVEGDREIDARLSHAFDNHRYAFTGDPVPLSEVGGLAPAYTSSLDSALALVERVLPGSRLELWQSADLQWGAHFRSPFTDTQYAKTPALALILALLKALQEGIGN